MRLILLVALYLSVSSAYGQYANIGGFVNFSASPQQAAAYGQAAINNSYGNQILNTSEASINFETANSMHMDNSLKGVHIYFQRRQANSYYRELEQLQKEEIKYLKRSGMYNIQTLREVYNTDPGFIIP